jgi:hypothetical protein
MACRGTALLYIYIYTILCHNTVTGYVRAEKFLVDITLIKEVKGVWSMTVSRILKRNMTVCPINAKNHVWTFKSLIYLEQMSHISMAERASIAFCFQGHIRVHNTALTAQGTAE